MNTSYGEFCQSGEFELLCGRNLKNVWYKFLSNWPNTLQCRCLLECGEFSWKRLRIRFRMNSLLYFKRVPAFVVDNALYLQLYSDLRTFPPVPILPETWRL